MARIPIPCGHEDYPCCGCDNVALTGEDALDVCCPYCGEPDCHGECEDAYQDDVPLDGDHDSAMASAGFGMDEDYNHYDYDDETPLGDAYGGE